MAKKTLSRLQMSFKKAADAFFDGIEASFFTLSARIRRSFTKDLTVSGSYLFGALGAVTLVSWLLDTYEYYLKKNKNIAETAGFLYKTTMAALVTLCIFGASVLAPLAVPVIFFATQVLDAFVSLGKGFYGLYKWLKSTVTEDKHFYRKEAKHHFTQAIIGAVVAVALGSVMLFAGKMVWAVAQAFCLASASVFTLHAIKSLFFTKNRHTDPLSVTQQEGKNQAAKQATSADYSDHLTVSPSAQSKANMHTGQALFPAQVADFYSHAIYLKKPLSSDLDQELQSIAQAIEEHLSTLKEKNKTVGLLEKEKLRQKIEILKDVACLLNISVGLHPAAISIETQRLISQLQQGEWDQIKNVLSAKYPKAYQAAYQKVGKTEFLVAQAFRVLAAKHEQALSQQAQVTPEAYCDTAAQVKLSAEENTVEVGIEKTLRH